MHFQSRKDHSINSMNENKENYSFEKKNYFLCLMIWFFEKTKSFFFLHWNILFRYFDRHKNVNRRRWFKFRRWCIVKREQLKSLDWWWDFFLHHRLRSNIFSELFNTCFHIDILSYYFSSLFSNICNEIARYVT
jgi:hypothetical protein